ncbi:DUF1600 domain-containing protein [Mycoplasmoides genitalium]|uniref:DUF1600 domain-containing protein n=1 Tax=Mycoplasmoides genitalium TaxID=2097 RepID=UPI00027B3886|nr:DUF1600 domain-containing protein [Mycoplasmoides genitalium]AFQ03438.1 hypothetical protein CM3_00805 [Mycoplasmoides genitalium M6282]
MLKKSIGIFYRCFYLNNKCDYYLIFLAPFSLFTQIFMVITALISVANSGQMSLIWFTNFDTFTYQSNSLAIFLVWYYFLNHKSRWFENSSLVLSVTGYLVFTVIFFNFYALSLFTGIVNIEPDVQGWFSTITTQLPYSFNGSFINDWNAFSELLLHVIHPLFYFIYVGLLFKTYKFIKPPRNLQSFLLKAGIYPSIYAFYLQTIPFLNVWDNGENSYSVYGFFTQTKYNSYVWIWSIPIFASMFLILWMLFVINNHYYGKKHHK